MREVPGANQICCGISKYNMMMNYNGTIGLCNQISMDKRRIMHNWFDNAQFT